MAGKTISSHLAITVGTALSPLRRSKSVSPCRHAKQIHGQIRIRNADKKEHEIACMLHIANETGFRLSRRRDVALRRVHYFPRALRRKRGQTERNSPRLPSASANQRTSMRLSAECSAQSRTCFCGQNNPHYRFSENGWLIRLLMVATGMNMRSGIDGKGWKPYPA